MITYDQYQALCTEFLSPKKAHLKNKVKAIGFNIAGKGLVSIHGCNFNNFEDAQAFCKLVEKSK